MKRLVLASSLALLAFAGTAEAAEPSPAGLYRLIGEQDVASQLLLRPDGRFQYFLIAGALDERAEGRWVREGAAVRLTTEPKPVAPTFSEGPATKPEEGNLTVKVVGPGGHGIAGVDLRLGFEEGEPIDDYTQEDGWSLPADERRTPVWIELAVPMLGLASPRFPIDAANGAGLVYVLTPNDIGVVDFTEVPVTAEPGRLVVVRHGGRLVYERLEQ